MVRLTSNLLRPARGSLKFSDVELLQTDGRYQHHKISNLYLRIQSSKKDGSRSRSWVFSYSSPERFRDGKRRRIEKGLGSYNPRTIAQVEARATELVGQIAAGKDPFLEIESRRVASVRNLQIDTVRKIPFEKVIEQYVDYKRHGWSHRVSESMPRSEKNWRSMLNSHAKDLFNLPFEEVTKQRIKTVLEPIWHTSNFSAVRLYNRLKEIHYWWVEKNEVEGITPLPEQARRLYLGEVKKKRNPHKGLDYRDIPKFWARLSELPLTQGVVALKLALLTGARPVEMRELRWDQIKSNDYRGRHLEIRNEGESVTKTQETYYFPVFGLIAELIDYASETFRHEKWVIPSPNKATQDKPLTETTARQIIDRLGYKGVMTVHGFRKSLKTFAIERLEVPEHIAESLLQHKIKDTYFDPKEIWQKRIDALVKYHEWVTKEGT